MFFFCSGIKSYSFPHVLHFLYHTMDHMIRYIEVNFLVMVQSLLNMKIHENQSILVDCYMLNFHSINLYFDYDFADVVKSLLLLLLDCYLCQVQLNDSKLLWKINIFLRQTEIYLYILPLLKHAHMKVVDLMVSCCLFPKNFVLNLGLYILELN